MVQYGRVVEDEAEAHAPWQSFYFDYAALKKLINAAAKCELQGEMVESLKLQAEFFSTCQAELAKASQFCEDEVKKISADYEMITTSVGRIVDPRANGDKADQEPVGLHLSEKQSLMQTLESTVRAPLTMTILHTELLGEHHGAWAASKEDGEALIRLVRTMLSLHDLRRFCGINSVAVLKILKKLRKKTHFGSDDGNGRDAEVDAIMRTLETCPLHESHATYISIDKMLTAVEELRMQVVEHSPSYASYIRFLEDELAAEQRSFAAAAARARVRRQSLAETPAGSFVDNQRSTTRHSMAPRRLSRDGSVKQSGILNASPPPVVPVVVEDQHRTEGKDLIVPCPCGVSIALRVKILLAGWWSDPPQCKRHLAAWTLALALFAGCIAVVSLQPERMGRLAVLGGYAAALVAFANGANDIANSVGTSVGAGALTLRQALFLGLTAEALGAMTLGSLVAKTISKGIVNPEVYASAGCSGVIGFGVSMVCVLWGTGLVTLLATLYGLPISASHGVIGGLIAVGLASQGPAVLGVASIAKTMVAWVASPAVGAVSSATIYAIILTFVHRSKNPTHRSRTLQPIFVAATVAVAVGFIVIKGPSQLKIKPAEVGAAASVGIGCVVGLLVHLYRCLDIQAKLARAKKLRHSMTLPRPRLAPERGSSSTASDQVFSDIEKARSHTSHLAHSSSLKELVGQAERAELAEKPFVPLLIVSALIVAFAHGANDVGNAVGPLAAVIEIAALGRMEDHPEIPLWVLSIGAAGFVAGIALLGSRTIATVGNKITRLTPSKSFAVQIGAAIAVLSSTVLGLAVSTSHCLVGSVVGIGLASKVLGEVGALNGRVLLKILIGWAVTIPLSMMCALVVYAMLSQHYGSSSATLAGLNGTCS